MQQAPDFSKRGSGLLVYPTSSIALSDTGYLFDFIEFVERLDRRQRIDVEAFDLIPDLHQHGIVQLKHRQLHVLGTGTLGGFLHGLRRGLTPPLLKTAARHDLVAAVDQLEVAQDFIGPRNDRCRHTAMRATWIPNECSVPPRSNLRRKTIWLPISLTETW